MRCAVAVDLECGNAVSFDEAEIVGDFAMNENVF